MRKKLVTVLGAVAAVPLAFASAGTAVAAPPDVTAVFTAVANGDGTNTVTGTYTFANGASPYECDFFDDQSYGLYEPGQYALFARTAEIGPNSATITDPDVRDGSYTINWYCNAGTPEDRTELWGTTRYGGIADAVDITLPVPVIEPEQPSECTGSVCLPTGSFGL